MNLSEVTQTLAVVGPVFGVVTALLGGYLWMSKRHIRKLEDEIEDLKREKEILAIKAERTDRAEARAKRMEKERDEAIHLKAVAEAEKAQADKDRDQARTELQSSEAKLTDLGRQLAATQATENRLRNERNHSKAEVGRLGGQLGEATQRADAADRRAQAAEAAASEAAGRATALDAKLDAERQARAGADEEVESLRYERDHFKAEVLRLTIAGDEQREALERYEAQVDAIAQQDGRVWEGLPRPTVPTFVPLARRGTATKEGTPVISLLNLKGGVGKTAITGNLGGYLDEHLEKRVLLIDLDHQRSLSQLLLSRRERELAATAHTIQRFLRSEVKDGHALLDCSRPVPGTDRCRLITNADPKDKKGENPGLDDLEMRLMSEWLVKPGVPDVRFLLRGALQSEVIQDQFDYVLIDCPPRLTTACINALVASDFLVTPCQAEAVSLASVGHLLRRMRALRECGVLSHLRILGVLANMVPSAGLADGSVERLLFSRAREVAGETDMWGVPVHFFNTMLKRDDNYSKATRFLENDEPLRLGIHYRAIQDDMTRLVAEIRNRIEHESRDLAGVLA